MLQLESDMKKLLSLVTVLILFSGFIFAKTILSKMDVTTNAAPPYGETQDQTVNTNPYAWLKDWQRPQGPAKVALQVGHWKSNELPEELSKLQNSTGTSGGGKAEWEVNLAIAQETANLLKSQGITVEILPATVPSQYWADVFVAIHADGSEDTQTTGYKLSAPWRDISGKGKSLVAAIDTNYATASGLPKDPNVTYAMHGYYAFSWWRYTNAIHPMTAAAIIETGFLTNPSDRKLIVAKPELAAQGIADGIIQYLKSEELITS